MTPDLRPRTPLFAPSSESSLSLVIAEQTPLSGCGEVGASLGDGDNAAAGVPAIREQLAAKRGLLSDLSYISQNRFFLPARSEF